MDVDLHIENNIISAKLKWRRPSATYGSLLSYRLQYGKVGEQLSGPLELPDDITYFTIQDLGKIRNHSVHSFFCVIYFSAFVAVAFLFD